MAGNGFTMLCEIKNPQSISVISSGKGMPMPPMISSKNRPI